MASKNHEQLQNLHAVEVTLNSNVSAGVVSRERPTDGAIYFGGGAMFQRTPQLFTTLVLFFTALASPLLIERILTGLVTGRGLLGSMALVFTFTAWRVIASRKREIQAEAERRLHRRALFHLNNEKGEVDWRELFWLLLALGCFGFLIVSYGIALAGEPVHFNSILAETSDQLKESVPLTGDQFGQLSNIALAVAVLEQELSSSPSMMVPTVRETRAQIRRRLKQAHELLIEAQVIQSGAVVQAIAKERGGAR